jgi:hypothetical protein
MVATYSYDEILEMLEVVDDQETLNALRDTISLEEQCYTDDEKKEIVNRFNERIKTLLAEGKPIDYKSVSKIKVAGVYVLFGFRRNPITNKQSYNIELDKGSVVCDLKQDKHNRFYIANKLSQVPQAIRYNHEQICEAFGYWMAKFYQVQ